MLFPVLRSEDNWLDNAFDDLLDDSRWPRVNITSPAINVTETEKEYELELAAPGATKKDFNVSLDNDNNLVIKMEHKENEKHEDKKQHYLRREFSYSNYQQTLTLPDDVEKDKIEAKVEDGVLHVTLPRKEQTKKSQKTIEIG